MTVQDWIDRELAKRPERSEERKAETRRRWGVKSVRPDDLDKIGVELPVTLPGPVDDNRRDIPA